ncbi:gliding motility-associated C-terminal domain-containing protein [Mucilaginibacter mali]|uniref:Gliding motility-associated C-terminal domain-containing protein n=1 Tax=Mucilaginibacter mali TaxID=2740462 RepID=A0A7D4Q614_9SPHI|nr:gliding motility-associated C-terminal domain-containing protein [Mucilaginibacter mali]QKJ32107.1 gliding motility-associated C-terminal domain-containing protein [Mucilaginibacter mali]
MSLLRNLLLLACLLFVYAAYGQQDVDFHLNGTFLAGKNVLKVKRDFKDPYLWVLVQGNQVYRINSTTKTVDDYTAQFSAYSGQQFVDITGVSDKLVYIALNSANILEYDNGAIRNISAADGIVGVVNSIGVDYTGSYFSRDLPPGSGSRPNAPSLLIGTNTGMCHYDYTNKVMLPGSSHVPARVFEATYRTEMFSDLEAGTDPDPLILYPAVGLVNSILVGYLWYGNNSSYGNSLNTAYYTDGVIKDIIQAYYPDGYMNFYWGTESGLFQNIRAYSRGSGSPQKKYLQGINVNKIASIYGLKSFGNSAFANLIKENLLVGTNQGLYFSNSGYWQPGASTMPNYIFFHYDGLGSKKINDVEVNATSYTNPVCEDGVWVAAIDGLYLLRPDYAPYIDPAKKITAIQFEGKTSDVNEIQVCGSAAAKAFVQTTVYPDATIQWYKNGQEIPNESNPTLSITQAGDYHAVLYDPCSPLHFESNHLTVTVISGPVFSFNYPDNLKYCSGSSATLQTDNNSLYQYRWYKDGVLNGNTTSTLSNITQPGKYKVEVSACSGSWVPSKEVQIDFIKMPVPLLTPDKAAYCNGEQAILSATVPIDATGIVNWQPYQYRWYKDGVLLNSATAATLNVTQPGKYKVEVTSCTGNTATSAEVQISFITLAVPVIKADKPAYCVGDVATLSTPFVNDGTYTINWLIGGSVIPSAKNLSSILLSTPGSYTVSISSNLTSCSQSSVAYPLSFDPPPSLILERIINTTLCDGQTVDLKANYPFGAVKWSTGETTDKISVKQSGTYTATVKTAAGCEVPKDITVQFLPNPVLNMPDATLCQFTNEQVTLTAPPGFVSYQWNGQTGGQTYTTNTLGQVTLTVTDQNGCKASQTINITSHCKDIHIPNTFTPNGDGVNDKWVIAGLEGDASVNVKIYNRTGALIFQSQGYAVPWDGTYQNKKVPAGVYYYVITAKGAGQVLSGSLTLIY